MYNLIKLNYENDALEPYISEKTITIHHEKHHKNFVDKLNSLLISINYDFMYTLEELISNIDQFPLTIRDDILYNAGGVLNHNLYFENMSDKKNTKLTGSLKEAIIKKYGSVDNFEETFEKAANNFVGSGYVFLVLSQSENLEIITGVNQYTPLSSGFIPLMTIDSWEHAYYLDYENRRNEYIDNFFAIVDYEIINENYEKNKKTNY